MERVFQISAVILAGIAAFFLWRGNKDGAFVAAVLGAVSFFLSIRFQVKNRMKIREKKENWREGELEDFDSPLLIDRGRTENLISSEQRTTDNEQKANL